MIRNSNFITRRTRSIWHLNRAVLPTHKTYQEAFADAEDCARTIKAIIDDENFIVIFYGKSVTAVLES
jgi:hypothetical protein